MRERALAASGKTLADASTNTTSWIVQSHDQSHGGTVSKHFSAAAVQTECIQENSGCVTAQAVLSSRVQSVQTDVLIPDIQTDRQTESVSVCVQTEGVWLCSSLEDLHSGGSQSSLRGKKRRGEGESHKRSLSEGIILVQKRRGGEHDGAFLEGSRSVLFSSQSAPGPSQVGGCT